MGLGPTDRRRELIQRLGELRSARVLVCMDTSTSGPTPGTTRHIFEHLRSLPGRPHNRVALVLFHGEQRPRDPEVMHEGLDHALRCMNLLREFTREVEVLVPSAAFGVGTFLAIGADRLLMHPLGTLGRIGAASGLASARHFLSLLREAGIDPQQIEHRGLERIVEDIGPARLGEARYAIERLHYGVRELVNGRARYRQEAQNEALFDALIDDACPLAHPLDRRRAKDLLALPVESMDGELETILWALFASYERALGLGAAGVSASPDAPVRALIESSGMCHAYLPESGEQVSGWMRITDGELH
ncbi:MAG: hypothetical protein CMH57_03765 [Myxococcales bacterium]|nr:hypothetical protein [Myxococcales bacterium]